MKESIAYLLALSLFSATSLANDQKTWLEAMSDAWNQSEEFRAELYDAAQLVPEIILISGKPLAVHGNYCGPNHGDPTYAQQPIDALDAACMNHDMCYDPNFGGLIQSCGCDYLFVDELKRNAHAIWELDYKTKGKALGALTLFSFSPCKCRLPSGRLKDLKNPSLEDKGSCL
jgi:hypothetical protein